MSMFAKIARCSLSPRRGTRSRSITKSNRTTAATSSCRRYSRNRCTNETPKAAALAARLRSQNECASKNIAAAASDLRSSCHGLAFVAETAIARRHFVLASRARAEWKIAARRAQWRPKIPDLDAVERDLARIDHGDASL